MSFRDDFLADLDDLRAIPGEFGIHRYQVWVRKTTYSGSRIGLGTKTVTDTRMLVGGQDPHVREVRNEDIVAGDDDIQAAIFEIGPLTPSISDLSVLDPAQTSTPTLVHYLIKGPGLPTDGLLCQKISDDVGKPFRYVFRVKSAGRNGT